MRFCEKLKEARTKAGLKQEELAKALGVSLRTITIIIILTVIAVPVANRISDQGFSLILRDGEVTAYLSSGYHQK